MSRLTTNKETDDMSMFELPHNSCYVKEGKARYRDYETDTDARELTKLLLKEIAEENNQFNSENEFNEKMVDYLSYGINTKEGLIATFYRNLWAMAELREKLKTYEDLEEQGKLIKLPCAVGDTVYEVLEESAPLPHFYIAEYEVQDVSTKAVKYADDWTPYNYKNLFFTRKEAERKLKEIYSKENNSWILCSERLPEENGTYLCTLDGELVGQAEPFTGMCGFENGEWDEKDCVIAWQKMPQPWKG